ncbi:MAG: hypothetical protein GX417_00480 [Clostridiales bacterium]|nr:hypothetical protein [Clostridiales bacterium]
MREKGIYKLKIDEGFKQLISPLSAEELQQLEQNIIRDGCREPLCVWNKTIVDGHNRYEICMRRQILFLIQYIFFRNREEAIAWICANQLGRRNITDETRKYLIGKRYETEKILGAHNAAGTNQHTKKEVRANMLPEPPFGITAGRTRERLGEEYRISHPTILKYEKYSQAMDKLSGILPELVPKILSGEVRLSHENVVDLSCLSAQDARRMRQFLYDGATDTDIRKIIMKRHISAENQPLQIPTGSIKDMPAYDPDAEISSLVFTIPSWISSIDRVRSAANFNDISDNARCKLEIELLKLKDTIESMMSAIKGVI